MVGPPFEVSVEGILFTRADFLEEAPLPDREKGKMQLQKPERL